MLTYQAAILVFGRLSNIRYIFYLWHIFNRNSTVHTFVYVKTIIVWNLKHVRGILMALSENYEIAYFRSVKNVLQHPLKIELKSMWTLYGCERDGTNLAILILTATIDLLDKSREPIPAELLERGQRSRLLTETLTVTDFGYRFSYQPCSFTCRQGYVVFAMLSLWWENIELLEVVCPEHKCLLMWHV